MAIPVSGKEDFEVLENMMEMVACKIEKKKVK
jgi:hypothetical protein